jgi:hypothetical protein
MNHYRPPTSFYRRPSANRLTQPLPRRLPIQFPDLVPVSAPAVTPEHRPGHRCPSVRGPVVRGPVVSSLLSHGPVVSSPVVRSLPAPLLSPIFYLPSTRVSSLSPRFALQNAAGFWELVLDGRYAILPQNQGLFYIAWLFAQPFGERIQADQFAGKVDDTFAWHHDFAQDMPWLRRHLDIKQIQANLTRKQNRLEKILDDPDELDIVKTEANHQIIEIYEERRNILTDSKGTAQTISEIVFANIYSVYATLAAACDYVGNPHPVARPFARHLLLYLLIPSIRATGPSRVTTFVYRPPDETTWSRWDAIPNL